MKNGVDSLEGKASAYCPGEYEEKFADEADGDQTRAYSTDFTGNSED